MRIVAIDTSTISAGVALWEDGKVLYEVQSVIGLTHSQLIMPMLCTAMDVTGWKPKEVNAYAVINGPGSFTGIRIGVATVKGLADAANVSVVGVNTLEALAYGVYTHEWMLPLLDARRGQVYTALYRWQEDCLTECIPPMACSWEEMADILPKDGHFVLCGDGAELHLGDYQGVLGDRVSLAPPNQRLQRASSCAILAAEKLDRGEGMEVAALKPFYIRASSAMTTVERIAARIGKAGRK